MKDRADQDRAQERAAQGARHASRHEPVAGRKVLEAAKQLRQAMWSLDITGFSITAGEIPGLVETSINDANDRA